jgi:hypothetical protein
MSRRAIIMAPKKKKQAPPGVPAAPDIKNQDLKREIEALELILKEKKVFAEQELQKEQALHEKTNFLTQAIADHKRKALQVTADLTREYKSTQDYYIKKVNDLETEIATLREETEMSSFEVTLLRKDVEALEEEKDKNLFELRHSITVLKEEFSKMLDQWLIEKTKTLKDNVDADHYLDRMKAIN